MKRLNFFLNRRVKTVMLLVGLIATLFALGTWSSLSAVKATSRSDDRLANQQGIGYPYQIMTDTLTITLYLPYVARLPTPTPTPTPNFIYYDNFSNPNSGWITGASEECQFEYDDGVYRITVTEDNGERCVAFNIHIPSTPNGTFSVKIRRTTPDSRQVRYGFYFGAGVNAEEDRWFLEVMPHDVECNGQTRGFFWLSAIDDGVLEFFDDICTRDIITEEDMWNELKIVRSGPDIDVYINGNHKEDYREHILLNHGYFDLVVVGIEGITGSQPARVEFDDFLIEP
jgi:hypothetical protein